MPDPYIDFPGVLVFLLGLGLCALVGWLLDKKKL